MEHLGLRLEAEDGQRSLSAAGNSERLQPAISILRDQPPHRYARSWGYAGVFLVEGLHQYSLGLLDIQSAGGSITRLSAIPDSESQIMPECTSLARLCSFGGHSPSTSSTTSRRVSGSARQFS
jgi:hypothetical protein